MNRSTPPATSEPARPEVPPASPPLPRGLRRRQWNWRWFISSTLRHSAHMRRHVRRLVHAQRDLLRPGAMEAIAAASEELRQLERENPRPKTLQKGMQHLEAVAQKHLRPHPHAGMRENVEVLLVAIAVAMGIRTFFLQPFKIPTGSMQPTLYGITHEDLVDQPEVSFPGRLHPVRLFDFWFNGVGYTHVKAKASGWFQIIDEDPRRFLLFNLRQRFAIGGVTHTVWFPPENLWERAGFLNRFKTPVPRRFERGDDVIKLKTISGDHLFVDRFTYNFRRPRRGEIIVFQTRGINYLPQDQYYIKRMVAMGGETVRIGNDRHLRINGRRLDASTPHFELVYSFDGPPQESVYSGHANGLVARDAGAQGQIAPLFPDGNAQYTIRENHYMVMGDNTLNSSDSRYWGDFPRGNVIGKSFFVYWPIGTQEGRRGRFGWAPN